MGRDSRGHYIKINSLIPLEEGMEGHIKVHRFPREEGEGRAAGLMARTHKPPTLLTWNTRERTTTTTRGEVEEEKRVNGVFTVFHETGVVC